jgi:hypothetical protein
VTNTNWQAYSGETTMSHLSQMGALAVQNFASAAVGIAVAVALIRGFCRHGAKTHCEAKLDGRVLDLTAKEFDFLAYLARHAGKVCTRRMILESVWGPQYGKEMHYLKVYAYRIRRKLGDEGGQFLQSDPSVGYRLMPPGEARPVS